MAQVIQIKRGAEVNLPSLAVGEPAITTDTLKVFIGSSGGNQQLGKAQDITNIETSVTNQSVGSILYLYNNAWGGF